MKLKSFFASLVVLKSLSFSCWASQWFFLVKIKTLLASLVKSLSFSCWSSQWLFLVKIKTLLASLVKSLSFSCWASWWRFLVKLKYLLAFFVDGGESGLRSHSQKRHQSPSCPARLHMIGSLSWFISR